MNKIDVLNGGFVRLVDFMGNDLSIVRSARVSYDADWREGDEQKDAKLISYLMKNRHCVTPETRILTRDLRWVPAGTLEVGDSLIAFEEMGGSYSENGMRKCRNYQECEVTSTGRQVDDVYELKFIDGTTIRCTGDHRWIATLQRKGDTKGGKDLKWYRTDELMNHLEQKRVMLPRTMKPWDTDRSWGAGFLAGAWDADGCLSKRTTTSRLQFAQYDNALLEKVLSELDNRGFVSSTRWSDQRSKEQTQSISAVSVLGGYTECMRFIGSLRPPRMLSKWAEENINERKILTDELVQVESITHIGKHEIVLLGTSTETYLAEGFMAHNTSPFESVHFTFEVKAPIFVFRQWHRHRTWAYNEISARYTELDEGFYVPELEQITTQHTSNKQMRTNEQHPFAEIIQTKILNHNITAFEEYKSMIAMGCPRELARSVLPVAAYSRMFASVDLHNLFHFLRLRLHEHSQYEIRVYAQAILQLIEPIVPVAVKEFKNTL